MKSKSFAAGPPDVTCDRLITPPPMSISPKPAVRTAAAQRVEPGAAARHVLFVLPHESRGIVDLEDQPAADAEVARVSHRREPGGHAVVPPGVGCGGELRVVAVFDDKPQPIGVG